MAWVPRSFEAQIGGKSAPGITSNLAQIVAASSGIQFAGLGRKGNQPPNLDIAGKFLAILLAT